MLRRFLLIGVGGSGGKTLRFLRRDLLERLDEAGWKEGMPVGWQFLQIDVPSAPDGNDPEIPPQLPDGSYVGLASPRIDYGTLDKSLLGPDASEKVLRACFGWRPDPEQVRINIAAGAGQHRTIGRVIAMANLKRVREAVAEAVGRMNQPQATTDISRLSRILGSADTNITPDPVPIVVSSIAGGTGAGIVLDVCDVVRAQWPWGENMMAALYAPDVFKDLPELGSSGVYPNALAALSELLAAFWNTEVAGEAEFALYEPAGVQMAGVKRRGPRYPFIIGSSNSYVNFGGQLDVYAGAASALAALITSESAQDSLVSYTFGNWALASGTADTLGLKTANIDELPLSSLGFASVSLGRDRFGRYVAERLARLTVDHLLKAHWVGRDVPDKMKPETALEEARELSFEWFLPASGLNELGETNNDILEGLQAPGMEAMIDEAVRDVMTQAKQNRDKGLKSDQWSQELCGRFNVKEPNLLASIRVASEDRARTEWVPNLQKRLVNLVASSLARDGAPVTAALLERLGDELGKVIVELGQEGEQRRRWAARRDVGIQSELAAFVEKGRGGGLIPPGSEFLTRAADKARKALTWAAEADLRGFAVEMARDLRENLVVPLQRAVAQSLDVLEREDSPPLGSQLQSPTRDWPQGNLLPKRFQPSVNERLVEPTHDYARMFEEQILTTTGGTTPVEAIRQAVREVTLGAPDEGGQVVVRITGEWLPTRLATASLPPSKASLEVRLATVDLLERAKAWVHRPNTAIGEHVRETLRRYLDPAECAPAELSKRMDRFHSAFTEALALSAPLVKVDGAVLHRTHNMKEPKTSYSFTEIPFPEGTKAREAVEAVMRAKGIDPTDARIQKTFGTGDQAEIDILSTLDSPFQPVVFESIMGPIAAQWIARQATEASRSSFWKWRRSRSLGRFVPMAPGVRRDFVKGWFAARALGQLRSSDDREPVEVWSPTERGWVPFPFPLIAPVASEVDFLPVVLESLPLALVTYATQGQQGEAALLPYRRLVELGDKPGPPIQRWITTGSVEEHAPPPRDNVGTPADDPALRRKKVHEYFVSRQTKYKGYLDIPIDQFNFFSLRSVWELGADIRPALQELAKIAEATEIFDDDHD